MQAYAMPLVFLGAMCFLFAGLLAEPVDAAARSSSSNNNNNAARRLTHIFSGAGTCAPGQNCNKDTNEVVGYKCPSAGEAGHKVLAERSPQSSRDGGGKFTCPSGSKAVKLVIGADKAGSDIFFPMGKTALNEYRNKNMCKMGNGNFRTGLQSDPYKAQFLIKAGTDSVNKKLQNQKLVRVMGYARGLMCSHLAPRMQVLINDKVMSSAWATSKTDSNNDRDPATSWSIEPPCKEKNGKKGLNQIAYDGKSLDPLNKNADWGLCSLAGGTLGCHQSNDFDSGEPTAAVDGSEGTTDSDKADLAASNGLKFWKQKSTDNILKLKLLCPGGAASINAAGIAQAGCHLKQQKWITVNVYTYKTTVTIYSTKTITLCKCGRPGNDRAIGFTFAHANSENPTDTG